MAIRSLRLGTRRSALARAQSGAVAHRLERLHPGLQVELVGIDTRGDRILDTPLSQVEGKEFFTAELDSALAAGRIDCTVHSFKDLSLERSAQFVLAAVPERENPRDIVLFAPDVRARLANATHALPILRIGSSSPRRAAFVPGFLQRALPGGASIELCELRGNVDTRLKRLHEPRGAERHLDGVVLALAGLARLWADGAGRKLLEQLLPALEFMVLPLSHCPAAPAQGALAVECRANDAAMRAVLAVLEHAPTRRAVAAERALLAERGGGCHQQFGATQLELPQFGTLLLQRAADDTALARAHWSPREALPARIGVSHWDGSELRAAWRSLDAAALAALQGRCASARALFVSHQRAWPESWDAAAAQDKPLWTPGGATWFALAARGLWVHGCGEGLGFEALRATLAEPVLRQPALDEWLALTHVAAVFEWQQPPAAASYELTAARTAPPPGLASAMHLWWHSAAQFSLWGGLARADAAHACGPGRTAAHLRRVGVKNLAVFPSVQQWREWLSA